MLSMSVMIRNPCRSLFRCFLNYRRCINFISGFWLQAELKTISAKKINNPAAHIIALQDFDAHIDIQAFFRQSFTTLYQENHLVWRSQPFPSDDDFDALAAKCRGLFIFAVTLM